MLRGWVCGGLHSKAPQLYSYSVCALPWRFQTNSARFNLQAKTEDDYSMTCLNFSFVRSRQGDIQLVCSPLTKSTKSFPHWNTARNWRISTTSSPFHWENYYLTLTWKFIIKSCKFMIKSFIWTGGIFLNQNNNIIINKIVIRQHIFRSSL